MLRSRASINAKFMLRHRVSIIDAVPAGQYQWRRSRRRARAADTALRAADTALLVAGRQVAARCSCTPLPARCLHLKF